MSEYFFIELEAVWVPLRILFNYFIKQLSNLALENSKYKGDESCHNNNK
jgi:hypothetical protein